MPDDDATWVRFGAQPSRTLALLPPPPPKLHKDQAVLEVNGLGPVLVRFPISGFGGRPFIPEVKITRQEPSLGLGS